MTNKSTIYSQPAEHYTSGDYWQNREKSESTYKVHLVDSLIKKSHLNLSPHIKAAELGCGQGAFLFPFADFLEKHDLDYQLLGYDISTPAINLAQSRNQHPENKLKFLTGSANDLPNGLDFIFCMDVIEHVENPFEFLRNLSNKSKYLILHLPIEHSIGHLLMRNPTQSYNTFKHIHFFSWESANLLIKESQFELVNYQFTAASDVVLNMPGSFKIKLSRWLRYFAYQLNPQIAAIVGGGSVLLLLQNL